MEKIITVDGYPLTLKEGLTLIASDHGCFTKFAREVERVADNPTRVIYANPDLITSDDTLLGRKDVEARHFFESLFGITIIDTTVDQHDPSVVQYEYNGASYKFLELPENLRMAITYYRNLAWLSEKNFGIDVIFCDRIDAIFHPTDTAKLITFVLMMSQLHPDKAYLFSTNSDTPFNTIGSCIGYAIDGSGRVVEQNSPKAVYPINTDNITVWVEHDNEIDDTSFDDDGYIRRWPCGFFTPDLEFFGE